MFQYFTNQIKFKEEEEEVYSFVYTNDEIQNIMKTIPLRDFIYSQYLKYIAHICRADNSAITKKVLFAKPSRRYYRDPWIKIGQLMGTSVDQAKRLTQSKNEFSRVIHQRFTLALR